MRHSVQASCAGKIACDLLGSTSSGVVYAVFQRTFYLKKTGNITATAKPADSNGAKRATAKEQPALAAVNSPLLCCIGQAGLVHGPLNISTSSADTLPVAVGEHWHSDNRLVTIGNIELDLTCSEIWQPSATHQFTNANKEGIEQLGLFLLDNAPSIKAPTRIEKLIDEQLLNASKQLQQWLYSTLIKQPDTPFPNKLLGCGDGLTPAGDDIIVGALLALRKWNSTALQLLITEVTDRINTTSEISAAHLLAACAGSGIEPLHQLIDAVSTQIHQQGSRYREQILDAANALASYGHSSGYYAMKGVLIAAGYQPPGSR